MRQEHSSVVSSVGKIVSLLGRDSGPLSGFPVPKQVSDLVGLRSRPGAHHRALSSYVAGKDLNPSGVRGDQGSHLP